MKSYKNIQELNEKWKNYGFQINNKGELVANHEGKEYTNNPTMLPNQKILEQVSKKIRHIPNKQGEYKRQIHYCCYLLCYQSGLRISEAINFNLEQKTEKGLYRIEKPKGKKERFVYIPRKVIGELKKSSWKPNQTNRFNFYHFLKTIKKELKISEKIQLTPHTLRRYFTTQNAEAGLPLPLLSKMLGHSSIRTTALYWQNTYDNNETEKDDTADILRGKKWLENNKTPKTLTIENFPKQPPKNLETATTKKPKKTNNLLTNNKTKEKINKIQPKFHEKFSLTNNNKKSNQIEINKTSLIIANKKKKTTKKEQILLVKIKNLEEKLKRFQTENDKLKIENKYLKALTQQNKEKAEIEAKVVQSLPWKSGK